MNKLLLILMLTIVTLFNVDVAKAQNWGLGVAYGTSTSIYADLFYLSNKNVFNIGGTKRKLSDNEKTERVKERRSSFK